jgi:hypothetical protein
VAADEAVQEYASLNRAEKRAIKLHIRRCLRRQARKSDGQLLIDFAKNAKSIAAKLDATDYATSLKAVIDTYFPGLIEALSAMEDPRAFHTHSLATVSVSRILMAAFMCASMRDWDNYRTESGVAKCVGMILGREAGCLPTWNTINNVLGKLDPQQLEAAITAACVTLMQIPLIQESKIFGCWQVIIDGTVTACSDSRMSGKDLTREHKSMYGATTSVDYYSYVVEMKLLVLGKVISIGSVPIENDECDHELDKRLAAFQAARAAQVKEAIAAAQAAQAKTRRTKRQIQLDESEKARLSELRSEMKARREAMPANERGAQKILDDAELASQQKAGRELIKAIIELEKKDQELEETRAERQKKLQELQGLRGKDRNEALLKLEADRCLELRKELESEAKQDCELNGLKKLIKSLGEKFPGESFCLAMDALYASQNVIGLIEESGHMYLIRTQNKKIPCITKAIMAAKELPETAGGGHFRELIEGYPIREYACAPGIKYKGNILTGLYMHDMLTSTFPFMFITNLPIKSQNDAALACKAGRDRWAIENFGFRFQKQMMHMTHQFSKNENAMKCHYLLIQIAHAICQFLEASCAVFRNDDGSESCGMKRFLQALSKSLIKNTKMAYNDSLVKLDAKLYRPTPKSAAAVCSSARMAS